MPWRPWLARHTEPVRRTVALDKRGRLVIPTDVRAALDLHDGDRLVIRVDDRTIVLESEADARARLRGFAAHVAPGRSLVDELLAERRATVARRLIR